MTSHEVTDHTPLGWTKLPAIGQFRLVVPVGKPMNSAHEAEFYGKIEKDPTDGSGGEGTAPESFWGVRGKVRLTKVHEGIGSDHNRAPPADTTFAARPSAATPRGQAVLDTETETFTASDGGREYGVYIGALTTDPALTGVKIPSNEQKPCPQDNTDTVWFSYKGVAPGVVVTIDPDSIGLDQAPTIQNLSEQLTATLTARWNDIATKTVAHEEQHRQNVYRIGREAAEYLRTMRAYGYAPMATRQAHREPRRSPRRRSGSSEPCTFPRCASGSMLRLTRSMRSPTMAVVERIVALVVSLAVIGWAGEFVPPKLELISNVTAEVHQDRPVSVSGGGRVSLRLMNTCGGPIGLEHICEPDPFYPVAIYKIRRRGGPVDAAEPAWGPNVDEQYRTQLRMVQPSTRWAPWLNLDERSPIMRQRRSLRNGRSTLALMPLEGYALQFDFRPGWIFADDVAAVRGQKQLAMSVPGLRFTLCIPSAKGGVTIGKPIVWDEKTPDCLVATNRPLDVVADASQAAEEPPAAAGLTLQLEIDSEVKRGQDFTVTYLVGNLSSNITWIWPNTLTPANVRWTLNGADGKPVGTDDGALAMPLQRLMPDRPAFPLLPGEFLCWRYTLGSQMLEKARSGSTCNLIAELLAPSATGADTPTAIPEGARLSAAMPVRIR